MDNRKKVAATAELARIALILAAVAVIAGGCGNKMARVEENQLRLQALVEMNAQHIGKVAQRIEKNQETLQVAIEGVRTNTQRLAGDIASVVSEHVELQKSVRAGDAQFSAKILDIEEKQANLQTLTVAAAADIDALAGEHMQLEKQLKTSDQTLAKKISAMETDQQRLQVEIESAAAGVARVTAGLEAIADAHAKLEEIARNDSERTDTRIAAIGQEQTNLQNEIQIVGSDVRKMAAEMAVIQQNLLNFQEVLQNDTQNLAEVIEMIGQGQIDLEGKVEKDFQKLAASVRSIEQNQTKLASQAATMQTTTRTMINDLSAALDRLKTATLTTEVIKPPKVVKGKNTAPREPKPKN